MQENVLDHLTVSLDTSAVCASSLSCGGALDNYWGQYVCHESFYILWAVLIQLKLISSGTSNDYAKPILRVTFKVTGHMQTEVPGRSPFQYFLSHVLHAPIHEHWYLSYLGSGVWADGLVYAQLGLRQLVIHCKVAQYRGSYLIELNRLR